MDVHFHFLCCSFLEFSQDFVSILASIYTYRTLRRCCLHCCLVNVLRWQQKKCECVYIHIINLIKTTSS